jgi:hypothetical protein
MTRWFEDGRLRFAVGIEDTFVPQESPGAASAGRVRAHPALPPVGRGPGACGGHRGRHAPLGRALVPAGAGPGRVPLGLARPGGRPAGRARPDLPGRPHALRHAAVAGQPVPQRRLPRTRGRLRGPGGRTLPGPAGRLDAAERAHGQRHLVRRTRDLAALPDRRRRLRQGRPPAGPGHRAHPAGHRRGPAGGDLRARGGQLPVRGGVVPVRPRAGEPAPVPGPGPGLRPGRRRPRAVRLPHQPRGRGRRPGLVPGPGGRPRRGRGQLLPGLHHRPVPPRPGRAGAGGGGHGRARGGPARVPRALPPAGVPDRDQPGRRHRGRRRWLHDSVGLVRRLRAEGFPLVGYTWWPLFALVDWRYRETTDPVERWLLPMGLLELERDGAGVLRRVPTGLVEEFRRLAGADDPR